MYKPRMQYALIHALLKVVVFPLMLSSALVVVKVIELYCGEVETITRSDTNNSSMTVNNKRVLNLVSPLWDQSGVWVTSSGNK